MALPEEIFNWIARYDAMPKRHSIGFLGSTHNDGREALLDELSRRYDDTLFQATEIPSEETPVPQGRLSRDAYYRRLQQCRVVLSLPGAGLDCFRFWEHAACNAVHISPRVPLFIPHDFNNPHEIIRFNEPDDLWRHIDAALSDQKAAPELVRQGRRKLLRHHLTHHRAAYFLDAVAKAFNRHRPRKTPVRVDRHLNMVFPKKAQGHPKAKPVSGDLSAPSILHLGLVKGENYGWGVCSRYLMEELQKLRPVRIIKDPEDVSHSAKLPGPLFQALTNVNFEPLFLKTRGNRNYGYTFFENELTRQSVENAKQYDLVLAGSGWCRDRMLEAGIANCDVLIQGIDPQRFYPITEETPRDRFVIFSGGKFELRKGQDILLRAVKILQDKYADIHLVNCWYNLWPESLGQMRCSPYIAFSPEEGESWQVTMRRTYTANGLDAQRITTLDLVPHELLRALYAQTDIAVFPNRCEGGTNLVLMEYMACAKPVIATATSGHNDVVTDENALLLRQLKDIDIVDDHGGRIGRWQDPSLDELVAQIEYAYHHREALRPKARQAGKDLQRFTWRQCAQRLVEIIEG
jgi:glycosyltransferase involved in cell wall biosynthesis